MNSSNIIPAPPVFKSSFIQMQRPQQNANQVNSDGEERSTNYLTSSYIPNEEHRNTLIHHSPSISPMTHCNVSPSGGPHSSTSSAATSNGFSPSGTQTAARRRRRSSSKEENERKRRDLKAQHSIIEKKRRIKMNREFEALKFLVPACRTSILSGLATSNSFENSNLMHKLTILQSTVEYIKYLHLIIRLMKLQMLIPKDSRSSFKSWFKKNSNLEFVDFDLDLNKYRDIELDFDFESLFVSVLKNKGSMPSEMLDPITKQISNFLNDESTPDFELLSSANDDKNNEHVRKGDCNKPPLNETRPKLPIVGATALNPTVSTTSLLNPMIPPPPNKAMGLSQHAVEPLTKMRPNPIPQQIPLTPMTLLKGQLMENKAYRRSICETQSNLNFKLPLPAIIDRHTDLLKLSSATNSSSSSSASPSTITPSERLSSILPHPRSVSQNDISQPLPSILAVNQKVKSHSMSHSLQSYSLNSSSSSSATSLSPILNNYYVVKDPNFSPSQTLKRVHQPPKPVPQDEDVHHASQMLISLKANSSSLCKD